MKEGDVNVVSSWFKELLCPANQCLRTSPPTQKSPSFVSPQQANAWRLPTICLSPRTLFYFSSTQLDNTACILFSPLTAKIPPLWSRSCFRRLQMYILHDSSLVQKLFILLDNVDKYFGSLKVSDISQDSGRQIVKVFHLLTFSAKNFLPNCKRRWKASHQLAIRV